MRHPAGRIFDKRRPQEKARHVPGFFMRA